MIATKLFAMCFLLVLTPQQKRSDESDSPKTIAQSIQGTAFFADKEPLSKVELEFKLSRFGEVSTDENRDSKAEFFRCETNSEGSFELTLPGNAEYSVDVVATKWMDGDRHRWHCTIPKLSSDLREPLNLVFENRGRIFLGFLGTSNLTASVKPSVVLSTKAGVHLNRELEPDSRGRMVIDGLEPSEYTIEVYASELSAKTFKQSVIVPSDPPFRAVATVQFPEFKFGTFKAIVMLPDGKTPAANMRFMAMSFDENSNSFGHKELLTDSEGRVTAKMGVSDIHLTYDPSSDKPQVIIRGNDFAAGGFKVDLGIDGRRRIAPAVFRAHVKADELTDMGTLRLQKEEEVFARVEGMIKYADGKPVENVISGGEVLGLAGGLPMIGSEGSFRPDPKLEAGRFSTRVRSGKRVIAIGIEGTGNPLGAAGGFILVGEQSDEKHVLLPLDLAAGDRIHRDVVLPNRESDRSLKISFQEPFSVAMVLVEIAPGVIWSSKGYFADGSITFKNVPEGECLVMVAGADYFASRGIAGDSVQEEIQFSKEVVGKLQVAIKDIEHLETKSFAIQLSIDSPLKTIPIIRAGAEHPRMKRNPDGSFVLEGIAPGKYHVTVGDGNLQFAQDCEIENQQATKLQF